MSLNRDNAQTSELGLVFKQTDVDGDSESTIFQPHDQPDAIHYPTNWAHTTIQSYTPQASTETFEDTPEPEPDDPEISGDIPGHPLISIFLGLCLITLINTKLIKNNHF